MRRILSGLTILGLVLVFSTMALAQGKGNGGGKDKGGDDGGGDAVTLPPVRYRISYVPSVLGSDHSYLNDLNDLGQAVGWSFVNGQRNATLFDVITGTSVLLVDLIDRNSIPEGLHLASAVGINNRGVVVGYLFDAEYARHPYAIDLGMVNPVVDLLPQPLGISAYARKINDRGDIVGIYYDTDIGSSGGWSFWHMNPNLYGPEELRIIRDGDNDQLPDEHPIDLRFAEYFDLFSDLGIQQQSADMDITEPDYENGFPAQFIANTVEGPVRYTVADSVVDPASSSSSIAEWFPEVTYTSKIGGINNFGIWAGRSSILTGKGNKTKWEIHRYGSGLEILPIDSSESPTAINDESHVLFESGTMLRDWGDGLGERAVSISDIVVGTQDDISLWSDSEIIALKMNNTGVVMGLIVNGPHFVAIEEPAQ
jgi:hypothetical protein